MHFHTKFSHIGEENERIPLPSHWYHCLRTVTYLANGGEEIGNIFWRLEGDIMN